MKLKDCPCECHQQGEWVCDKCDTEEKVNDLKLEGGKNDIKNNRS